MTFLPLTNANQSCPARQQAVTGAADDAALHAHTRTPGEVLR